MSIGNEQPSLVDRLLAHMQQRFPKEFEICLLAAQNEELQLSLAQAEERVSAFESVPESSEIINNIEYKSTEDPWTFMPNAECAALGGQQELAFDEDCG